MAAIQRTRSMANVRSLRARLPALAGLAVLLSVFLATSPAVATPPEQYAFGFDFDDVYACDGFTLSDHTDVTIMGRIFLDSDGNPVRDLFAVEFRTKISGADFAFDVDSNVNFDWDIPAETLHRSGVTFNIVVPGQGTVFQEIGTAFHIETEYATVDEGSIVQAGGPHEFAFGGRTFPEIVCGVGDLFQ